MKTHQGDHMLVGDRAGVGEQGNSGIGSPFVALGFRSKVSNHFCHSVLPIHPSA